MLLSYINEYLIKWCKHHRFIALHLSNNNKPTMFVSFAFESIEIESAKVRAFDYTTVILSTYSYIEYSNNNYLVSYYYQSPIIIAGSKINLLANIQNISIAVELIKINKTRRSINPNKHHILIRGLLEENKWNKIRSKCSPV